jgi:hypothetical protein
MHAYHNLLIILDGKFFRKSCILKKRREMKKRSFKKLFQERGLKIRKKSEEDSICCQKNRYNP